MSAPAPSECIPLARDKQFLCAKHGRLLLDCEMERLKEGQVLLTIERDQGRAEAERLLALAQGSISGWQKNYEKMELRALAAEKRVAELEKIEVVELGNEKMLMVNEKHLNKCWICDGPADTCTKCASKAVEKAHTAAKGA